MVRASREPQQLSSRAFTLILLLISFVCAFVRSQRLLLHGRLVAEEGTDYLRSAWNQPWWHALLQQHLGYFSLLDNGVAALAAAVFPLRWAGLVFTWSAMGILLLTVSCFVTSEVFPTRSSKALAAFLCVFCPSIKVWMTLEDAQFYLAAAVAIVLVSNPSKHRIGRIATTTLAGLSGPVACALTPFAIVRAVRLRSRLATLQAGVLGACCVLQGVLLERSLSRGARSVAHAGHWSWAGPIFAVKVVALTFVSRSGYTRLMDLLRFHLSAATFALAWALAIVGVLAFVWIAKQGGAAAMWLLGMALWGFVFSYAGVLEPPVDVLGGDNRYFFLTVLLVWTTVLLAWIKVSAQPRGHVGSRNRLVIAVLLVLVVFTGARDARLYWSLNQLTAAPWPGEVASWQQNPDYRLRVWPASWRGVQLTPHHETSH